MFLKGIDMTMLTPKAIAAQAIAGLRASADPVRAEGARRYFKHTIAVYGVAAPAVRALASGLYTSVRRQWTFGEAAELCEILLAEPELESKAVGTLILGRFKKEFPPALLARAKTWLAGNKLDSWAAVDGFCADSLGALIAQNPALVTRVKRWAFHPNRWVKRAAAVSFIKLAKQREFLPAIYEISESLFPVDDDLVQKANGWLLREAGKADEGRLERFLLAHGSAVPRTTLRYAIERFSDDKRRRLLLETR
jgi:3-methyladenine DNA glycosylase AlkD